VQVRAGLGVRRLEWVGGAQGALICGQGLVLNMPLSFWLPIA
jgi:hypothetical protein